MSSSPVIPREKLSAYQRWELHSFDGPPRGKAADERKTAAAEKVQHIHELAYQAGLTEGLRRGAQLAAEDLQRLKELLAAIGSRSAEDEQHAAGDVLALALELGRQMTRRALNVRPELILPVIQDALTRVLQPLQQPAIILHPDDAKLVREHLHDQLAAGGWSIVEDARAPRGGCMLNTAESQVDATARTRWQQLADALGQESEWLG